MMACMATPLALATSAPSGVGTAPSPCSTSGPVPGSGVTFELQAKHTISLQDRHWKAIPVMLAIDLFSLRVRSAGLSLGIFLPQTPHLTFRAPNSPMLRLLPLLPSTGPQMRCFQTCRQVLHLRVPGAVPLFVQLQPLQSRLPVFPGISRVRLPPDGQRLAEEQVAVRSEPTEWNELTTGRGLEPTPGGVLRCAYRRPAPMGFCAVVIDLPRCRHSFSTWLQPASCRRPANSPAHPRRV